MNVIILQEEIVPYRVDFYLELSKHSKINFTLIVGKKSKYNSFKIPKEINIIYLDTFEIKLINKRVLFYKNLLFTIKKIQPDIIVLQGEIKFLQNNILLLFQKYYKYKIYIWKHAFKYRGTFITKYINYVIYYYLYLKLCSGFIVYTEFEFLQLSKKKNIPIQKISYLNNTIATEKIHDYKDLYTSEYYDSMYDNLKLPSTPFISYLGNIVTEKRVDLVIDYYLELKSKLSSLSLLIIGDGKNLIELKMKYGSNKSIYFLGPIYDEKILSYVLKDCKFIFSPGYVGLSIMHSFANAIPFITFYRHDHSPEIKYLQNGENGLILHENEKEKNLQIMLSIINDREVHYKYKINALKTSKLYTNHNMVKNFLNGFLDKNEI